MSALRAVESDQLGELAAQINAEHEQVWRAGRVALEHAVKAGVALLQAQALVERGGWLTWMAENVTVHPTSAYKYMRLARYKDEVLASGVDGVQAGLDLIADKPWHERSRLDAEDKATMRDLIKTHSLGEVAECFGCAESTVWRWTSDRSPAADREKGLKKRGRAPAHALVEITDEMIEIVAVWLAGRYGSGAVTDEWRGDAVDVIGLALGGSK